MHWRDTSGNGPWPVDVTESVIDYDSNGEINDADLAALARYFDVWVSGYNIYTSQDAGDYPAANDGPNGPGAVLLDIVGRASAIGDSGVDRLRFIYTVAEPQAGDYYWVRPVDGAAVAGTPSTLAGGPE